MAKRIIPKSNIPNQHDGPTLADGTRVRVFTREELAERRKLRESGKLVDKPVELLPTDASRIRKRHNVTLSREASRIARGLADGNVSRGIERALLHYVECALAKRPGRPKKSKPDLP